MATRIIEKVRAKMISMEQDPDEAEANGILAAAAIMGGPASAKWIEYMSQFVENTATPLGAAQLSRLLATDNTKGDVEMDRKRAYLLSNGVCGGASTGLAAQPGDGAAAAAAGGGAAQSRDGAAAQPAAAATPEGLPLDFLVNSIDLGLDLACLDE